MNAEFWRRNTLMECIFDYTMDFSLSHSGAMRIREESHFRAFQLTNFRKIIKTCNFFNC